jgi:hypothetical protein
METGLWGRVWQGRVLIRCGLQATIVSAFMRCCSMWVHHLKRNLGTRKKIKETIPSVLDHRTRPDEEAALAILGRTSDGRPGDYGYALISGIREPCSGWETYQRG